MLLLTVFSILALTPFLVYLLNAGSKAPVETSIVPQAIAAPSLVVPETPLGTLSLLGATLIAFIVFVTVKKRR